MTTPTEFVVKTNTSWAYPQEMYVYDGALDKTVSEVYAWDGTNATLVWPVPFYLPYNESEAVSNYGTTLNCEPQVWIPLKRTNNDAISPLESSTTGGNLSTDWDTQSRTALCGSLMANSDGTPYQVATSGVTAGWTDGKCSKLPVLNPLTMNPPNPSLDYSAFTDVTMSISADGTGTTWNDWEFTPFGAPLYKGNTFNIQDLIEDGDRGVPNNSFGQVVPNVYGWSVDSAIGAWGIWARQDLSVWLNYNVDPDSRPGAPSGLAAYPNGLPTEPFPQFMDSSVWDGVTPWDQTDNAAILAWSDWYHRAEADNQEVKSLSGDCNIAYISYMDKNGDITKLRFDNCSALLTGNDDFSYSDEPLWLWSIRGTTQMGFDVVNFDGSTDPSNYDDSLFPDEYSAFLTAMSYPEGNLDYTMENYRVGDWNITKDGDHSRELGVWFQPGELKVVQRKPLSDSRLVWSEVGCIVGSEHSSGDYYNATPGVVSSSFDPSSTCERYRSTRISNDFRGKGYQLEYQQTDGTQGDYRYRDGSFQRDFFDDSNYLELYMINNTTGRSMRSFRWGDGTERKHDDSITSSSRTFYSEFLLESTLRPYFEFTPDEAPSPPFDPADNPTDAIYKFNDFFNEGDNIDFKLYSR